MSNTIIERMNFSSIPSISIENKSSKFLKAKLSFKGNQKKAKRITKIIKKSQIKIILEKGSNTGIKEKNNFISYKFKYTR